MTFRRQHVLQDLEPYICTFSSCSLDTFNSQRAWFEHELLVHRSQWICPECSISFGSSEDLKGHVSQNHSGLISNQQLSAFIEQSKRPVDFIEPSECPFCDDPWAQADASLASSEEVVVVNLEQFQQHLGKHLQQVALFSLPRPPIEDHDQSGGRRDECGVLDRDTIIEGWKYLGRGWSIVLRKRTTFIAFASFLNLSRAQWHISEMLSVASSEGDEILVQQLLDQGAKINSPDVFGDTPLQVASFHGHEKVVQLLLNQGADINKHGGQWGGALQAASFNGQNKMIQLLLDQGVDVNLYVRSKHFSNALQAAILGGHEETIQFLLDRGADINSDDGRKHKVLQEISQKGCEKVIQLLFSQGVNVNVDTDVPVLGVYYRNALQAAAHKGQEKVIQVLLDHGADINTRHAIRGDPLQHAASNGHERVVQLLLDRGANVTANTINAAASEGHERVVQLLLDRGANVTANTLIAAASEGHEKVVQLILNEGVNIDARNSRHESALQVASYKGHMKLVEFLLNKGASVNAQGGRHGSALQAAAYGGHEQIVELLLSHEANVNAQGGTYGNAFQAASSKGHEKIMQILLESGADKNVHSVEYAFVTVTVLGTDHKLLLQLIDFVFGLKRRIIDDILSGRETLRVEDVLLVLDDKIMDERQICMTAGLKEGSHVHCHLENQPTTDSGAQT